MGSWTKYFCLTVAALLLQHGSSRALELTGFTGYHIPYFSPKDQTCLGTPGGVGYGFSARVEAGSGSIESGFLFSPVVMNLSVGTNEVRTGGSYWILPVLYRVPLLSPFLSLGIGPDFAVRGGTTYTIQGTALSSSPASGFRSHFGGQISLQAVQDIGENLSAVVDLRYRRGLGPSISVQSTTSTLSTLMISLGIQKRLE